MLARIRKTEVEAQGRYRKLWLERHKLWYSLLYRQAIVRFIAKFNSDEYADPPKRKTMYAQLRKQQATYARRRIDAVGSLATLVPPQLTPATARDWVQQMDELAEETHELHTRVTANIKKFEAKLAADGHKLLSELIDTVRLTKELSTRARAHPRHAHACA